MTAVYIPRTRVNKAMSNSVNLLNSRKYTVESMF